MKIKDKVTVDGVPIIMESSDGNSETDHITEVRGELADELEEKVREFTMRQAYNHLSESDIKELLRLKQTKAHGNCWLRKGA